MSKYLFLSSFFLLHCFNYSLSGQNIQSIFLDDFQPKTVTIPPFEEYSKPLSAPDVMVSVNANDTITKVSKYLYGNNSNVYMGQMVNEPILIKYIKNLSPNIIRYPGGNLSNLFFWNAKKGVPPADAPDTMVNGNRYPGGYWYGMSKDSFTMNVDNYYLMLRQTNSTGLICINYGYARYGTGSTPVQTAAHLAADWVRYDKGRTKFWELGNENFGPWQAGFEIDTSLNKDRQPRKISGQLYGMHFKIFADSMRNAAKETGSKIKIGAVIVEVKRDASWYNPVETNWNEGFFKAAGDCVDFFIIHSYFTPFMENSTVETILNTPKPEVQNMHDYMIEMCSKFNVSIKPLALSEWNIRAIKSKQSCSFISGMHATMVLGELIKNKFGEASRWDFANGYDNGDDHGMFNKGDETGLPKWNPRPAYFYMYYFQRFFGDYMIQSSASGSDDIITYASKFSSGQLALIIVNKSTKDHIIKLSAIDYKPGKRYYLYSLTGGKDNVPFSQCVFVNGHEPDNIKGGPINNLENIKAYAAKTDKGIVIVSTAYSVQYVLVE